MRNKTKFISAISGAALLLNATVPVMALGISNSATPRGAIEINDCSGLQEIKDGNDYYLGGDITDCSGTFTAIPTFNNTLDGKGYTIEGLEGIHLFTTIGADAIIKNIVFENVVLSGHRAALVDSHYGEISNISVSGTITGASMVASIATATAGESKINNSYSTAVVNLNSSDSKTGGLVGLMEGDSIVSKSYFAGEIDSKGELGTGGIAGIVEGNAKVENSYVDAPNITAPTKMGAIVGEYISVEPLDNTFYSYRTAQGSSTDVDEVTAEQLSTPSWYLEDLGFENGEEAWYLVAPNEAERSIPTPKLPNPQLSMEIDRVAGIPGTPAKPEDPSNPGDGNDGSNGNGTINGDDVVYGQGQLVSTANTMLPMLATAVAGLALNNKKRK